MQKKEIDIIKNQIEEFCHVQNLGTLFDNELSLLREDLIPFSFGGNKARISLSFVLDAIDKKCDTMIAYGDKCSNLCRALINLSHKAGMNGIVINSSGEDYATISNNGKLLKFFAPTIVKCNKENVPQTINYVKNDICKGKKYYYMYDDENVLKALSTYKNFLLTAENNNKLTLRNYDYVFLPTGTGFSQSGILAYIIEKNIDTPIIGISIARKRERELPIFHKYMNMLNIDDTELNDKVNILDEYLCNGYGQYTPDMYELIQLMYTEYGIPMDTTYVGKAFWGMKNYLAKAGIKNKKILFIHTGGLPLFFDELR